MYQLPMVAFFGVLSDTQACNGGREKKRREENGVIFLSDSCRQGCIFPKKECSNDNRIMLKFFFTFIGTFYFTCILDSVTVVSNIFSILDSLP